MHTVELAEQFFLIGHDEFSGRPGVSHELVECGLVGAVLGGLVIDGRLGVKEGKVVVLDGEPGGDDLASKVVETVDRQAANHRVRTWAEQLGPDLYRIIATRLVTAGILRRERGRTVFGRSDERYPAVDLYTAARPRLMLNHVIATARRSTSIRRCSQPSSPRSASSGSRAGHEPRMLRPVINSLLNAMPNPIAGTDGRNR